MSALVTPLSRTDLFAAYGEERLPVIGFDERDRPLVLTRKGKVVLARMTRVGGESFSAVVVR